MMSVSFRLKKIVLKAQRADIFIEDIVDLKITPKARLTGQG